MRLSITTLLFLLGFFAICCSLFVAEEGGQRQTMVTSIDFAPKGDHMVVCVHEFNGESRDDIQSFDRSIYLMNYDSLEVERLVIEDRQDRPAALTHGVESKPEFKLSKAELEQFFWVSQTKVINSHHSVFFLDSDCRQLLHYDITTGETESCVKFESGQILSFDAATNGRQTLVQGEFGYREPHLYKEGSVVVTDGVDYWMFESDDGDHEVIAEIKPDKPTIAFYHDVFGVTGTQPAIVPENPFDPVKRDSDSKPGETDADSPIDNAVFANISQLCAQKMRQAPEVWRLAFIPTDRENKPSVGLVSTTGLFAIDNPLNDSDIFGMRRKGHQGIQDLDVSDGECKCVRVTSAGHVVMHFADKYSKSLEAYFTSYLRPARISLSKDGKHLAVSRDVHIELYDIENLVDLSDPATFTKNTLRGGLLPVIPRTPITIKCDSIVSSIEFSPSGSSLLAGDSTGKITVFDSSTGDSKRKFKIPGRARGLNKRTAYTILFGWIGLGVVWVSFKNLIFEPEDEEGQEELALEPLDDSEDNAD